ncbi:putative nuclease [Methanophagales archaeon]|nr:putative nuclease [Methanophagales archaeon]
MIVLRYINKLHKLPLRATSCLGEVVNIDVDDIEQYDPHYQILAVVYVDERNLNEKLLKEGYAEGINIPPSEFYSYEWTT